MTGAAELVTRALAARVVLSGPGGRLSVAATGATLGSSVAEAGMTLAEEPDLRAEVEQDLRAAERPVSGKARLVCVRCGPGAPCVACAVVRPGVAEHGAVTMAMTGRGCDPVAFAAALWALMTAGSQGRAS